MRIITDKQITESAWHIGRLHHALLHGDDIERLDAVQDLAELTFIVGGLGLLNACGNIKRNK